MKCRLLPFTFAIIMACAAFFPGVAILNCTEFSPWFGNVLELDAQAACTANGYRSISTGHGTKHRSSCDTFFDLSASLAYRENLSFELEAVAADTSHDGFGMDSILFTARTCWMNDITAEDPISLTGGLTVSQVFKPGLRDLSSFHHGGIQCEAHLAAGKEYSCMQFWTSRLWGVFGAGIADLGSVWVRGNVVWEHNWWNNHQAQVFVRTLWGLGHDSLNLRHFRGYGPIAHQSVDLGGRYSYLFCTGASLSLEYGYRVYGRNCPKGVSIVSLNIFYPLKL